MNECHFPIVCDRWDNGGGLVFMYEFMHDDACMQECIISLYMSVGVQLCMHKSSQKYFIPIRPQYSMHKSESSTQSSKEKATQKGESR